METAHPSARVFIVDDSAVIRERLVELIDGIPDVAVVGQAETAQTAVEGILDTQPDCVVLDLQLRGSNGLTVLRELQPRMPSTVFLVLTNHASAPYCRLCLAAGASYFFDKSGEMERVREAISAVATHTHVH